MANYAIIETGSKQYWVEPNKVLEVEKLNVEKDQKVVELNQVLFAKEGDRVEIGRPVLDRAKVICQYLGEIRGPKVIAFKYRRRKASRNKKGHRQSYTKLLVQEIKF